MKKLAFLLLICNCSLVHAQIFTKITDSPVSTTPGDSRSVNWVDVNGDGYTDLFITNGPEEGQNNMLYMNDGNGNFSKVAQDPIVKDHMPSDGATFADIDNDGDPDAFVVNWYNRNNLAYINDGSGKFTQIQNGLWVNHLGFSETAAFGDYNSDGLVDLYVTNSAGSKKNFLYQNLGDHEMQSITGIAPVTDAGSSRNASWTDIDSDGDPDLFVTNENNEREDLYRNDQDGAFVKLTTPAITAFSFSTMSSSWGDIDNDGDQDVFLANDGSKNQLFRNDGAFVFTNILNTDISKTTAKSFSSAWGDIDNDGDLDLFVTNAFQNGVRLANNLYLNDGTGMMTEVTDEVVVTDKGWSYGCAFGDYDNDGFLDLAVATTRFGITDDADYLYHNNGNENHWILISLEGTTSNRTAIGAKVRVKATINGQPVWQMREISAQSAYCSQNDMRAHFGLEKAAMIDSIVVEWPSGIRQILIDVPVNQILQIKEEQANAVKEELASFEFNVFPNPTRSEVRLEAHLEYSDSVLLLEIMDHAGKRIHYTTIRHTGGLWQHQLNLKELQLIPGQYFIRLSNGVSGEERKVILTY